MHESLKTITHTTRFERKRDERKSHYKIQVAHWATIAHLGASIMFEDTIMYDAQRQVALNLKQWPGIYSNTQDIMPILVICKC